MLGYSIHPPFVGQVDGMHPLRLVDPEYRAHKTADRARGRPRARATRGPDDGGMSGSRRRVVGVSLAPFAAGSLLLAAACVGGGPCPATPVPSAVPPASAAVPPPLILEDSPDAKTLGEAGWIVSGGARDSYVVHRDTAGGRTAWVLEPHRDTFGKYGTWMRQVAADAFRGKRVRITATLRTEGATRRADLWVRAQGQDSPGDGLGLAGDMRSLPADSEWTSREAVIDVPVTAAWLEYGAGIAGPGRIRIDGMKAEIVGKEVPLTRVPSRPAPVVAKSAVPEWNLTGDDATDYASAVDQSVKHAGHASGMLRIDRGLAEGFRDARSGAHAGAIPWQAPAHEGVPED